MTPRTEAAIVVYLLVPLVAAALLGWRAFAAEAVLFGVAALGEYRGWWRETWILGDGSLGHVIGVVSSMVFAAPATIAGGFLGRRLGRRAGHRSRS